MSLSRFSIGRRVLPLIVALAVFPVPSLLAQVAPAEQSGDQPPEETLLLIGGDETAAGQTEGPQAPLVSSWDFIRMLLILGAVVAAIYVVVRLLRRGMRRQVPQNDLIRLLGTRALSANRALHVVELGTQVFLVGAAENGISLISRIRDQETLDSLRLATSQAAPQTAQGFAQFLQSFLRLAQKSGPAGGPRGGRSARSAQSAQDTLDFMKQQRERLQKL